MTAEMVAVDLADGTQLRGMRWPASDCWTLLLHEPGADHDIDELVPLIDAVVRSGSTAVAFDLPGHGFSDGTLTPNSDLHGVVGTLLDWVDRQRPAKTGIVAIGETCYIALQSMEDRPVDVLVLISPPPKPESRAFSGEYRGAGASKLLVVGGADKEYRSIADEMRKRSIGWAVTLSVGTSDQRTELIAGTHRRRIQEGIELFLREQWAIGRRRGVPKAQAKEIAR